MTRRRITVFAEAVFYTAFLSFVVGSAAYSGYNTEAVQPISDVDNNSDDQAEQVEDEEEGEEPAYLVFEATAYCDFGITFSGVLVQRGIVAADPKILPIGSVIEVRAGKYSGIYTVMDTGGLVKGRIIDIYMPEYEEAIQFGRQQVGVRLLRIGWDPEQANPNGLVDPSLALAG